MPNDNRFETLNSYVAELSKAANKKDILLSGLKIADEIMHIIGIPYDQLDKGEKELDKAIPISKFKNQKMEQWFEKHPYFGNSRIALYHYNKGIYPIESMFYMLSDSPRKEKIAATTQLFANWEDSPLTMIPSYKVGVDFFLSPKTKSLLFVVSKKTNLRVMELSGRLTHTQIEIFNKIQNVALTSGIDKATGKQIPLEPQRTIHTTLWNALELKEVNKKFYVGIADHFTILCQYLRDNPPEGVSKEQIDDLSKIFASRLIGRLLFVWFLRKKRIINTNYNYFKVDDVSSTDYYETRLKKLFFNTLNTPVQNRTEENADLVTPYLNGGLFEPHSNDLADRVVGFPEGWFVTLFNHLNEFNFTTDESSIEYEQVAIDPEMLGRVFENLLASIVPETKSKASKRKKMGAFYTPREIVSYMCKCSLKEYLKRHAPTEKDYEGIDKLIDLNDSDFLAQKSTGTADLWGARSQKVKAQLIESLNNLKVLDPACGSGAFPIGMLQLILKTYDRLTAFYDKDEGKMRPIKPTEHNDVYLTKLFIIRNNLYGVDLEPMAIEIARLRAWLSLIIDDKKDVEPLPNLDFNFVCANSLISLEKQSATMSLFFDEDDFQKKYNELINEYFNTHDIDSKKALRQKFRELFEDADIKDTTNRATIKRVGQLKSWNPFDSSMPARFFDSKTMFNVDSFDIVIGNPPYIQLQTMEPALKQDYQEQRFETFTFKGDIYCLFIEKGISFLSQNGILIYITSNKWMRDDYGSKLRAYLSQKNPLLLIDFGGTKIFDSATVDTDILEVANEPNKQETVSVDVKTDPEKENSLDNLSDYVKHNCISVSFDKGQNRWTVLTPIEESIKKKIEANGVPLKKWNVAINYGIKTGYDPAFIIDGKTKAALISEDPKSAEVIRPILRGRDIKRYGYEFKDLWLLFIPWHFPLQNKKEINGPSKEAETLFRSKYSAVYKHLLKFKEKLEKRNKAETGIRYEWYALQRWGANYLDDFSKPKIIFQEIVQSPAFYYDKGNQFYCLDTGRIIVGQHLPYLCIVLNSNLFFYAMKSYLSGGMLGSRGVRMKHTYFENFVCPIPTQEQDDQSAKLVDKIENEFKKNGVVSNETLNVLNKFIYDLYKITPEEKQLIEHYLMG